MRSSPPLRQAWLLTVHLSLPLRMVAPAHLVVDRVADVVGALVVVAVERSTLPCLVAGAAAAARGPARAARVAAAVAEVAAAARAARAIRAAARARVARAGGAMAMAMATTRPALIAVA